MQDETAGKGFNAVTTYILFCMILIALAMIYYGLILFNLRKILKINVAEKGATNEKDVQQMTNSVIKFDRLMLVTYVIIFSLFNIVYFISYLAQK